MSQSLLWQISTFVIPLFLSIILHEMAHGWVAYKCGDATAKMMNRLSFNPLSHIDPLGSVVVPVLLLVSGTGVMFGWARPVPVNFNALRDKKHDMGLVALAGPMLNFILAVLAAICLVLVQKSGILMDNLFLLWFKDSLQALLAVNLGLCAFNLFPLLPLDGGRILVSILPDKLSLSFAETERYGFFILIALLFFLPILGIDILHNYVVWIREGLMRIIYFILEGVF